MEFLSVCNDYFSSKFLLNLKDLYSQNCYFTRSQRRKKEVLKIALFRGEKLIEWFSHSNSELVADYLSTRFSCVKL